MALRSAGWSVRPSFVPHGPTTGVTLLADDVGITQLAGIPDVAWQTPWSALSDVQLVRSSRSMSLLATAAGVRYCWRTPSLQDFEAWRELVLAHGGTVARRTRRAGVVAVVLVVLVASLGGAIAALFTGSAAAGGELASARDANVRLDDLPAGFAATTSSVLIGLVGRAGAVYTPSATTQPKPSSAWAKISAEFQGCVGVSARRDRMYGAAGQQPDYQVSSAIYHAALDGGVDLVTSSQYYKTTTMVRRDVAEMSMAAFGSCFANVNAAELLAYLTGHVPVYTEGVAWRPVTFVPGWSRGGEIDVSVPGIPQTLHLVVAVVAGGHHEVTLAALVGRWPQARPLLGSVVNTIKSRIVSPSSTAA
ncbi:MAG TPA: hypothetical protein VGS61_01690 [Acidimicrobiales bacterium]|nr:hypothetical protein [Acidimicrobiales bacterium]